MPLLTPHLSLFLASSWVGYADEYWCLEDIHIEGGTAYKVTEKVPKTQGMAQYLQ